MTIARRTSGSDTVAALPVTESTALTTSPSETALILTGLRFLLEAEDDPALIEQLKALIDRLEDHGITQAGGAQA